MSAVAPTTNVSFTLNGGSVQVSNANPNTTLNEWIRSQYGLTGTKKMCGEGGCGCCAVSVLRKDPTTGKDTTISVNSVSLIRLTGVRQKIPAKNHATGAWFVAAVLCLCVPYCMHEQLFSMTCKA